MAEVDLYLMSPPGPRWALRGKANFRSEGAPPVDPERALFEWMQLADGIERRAGRVACLLPDPDTTLTGLPYAAECGQIVERRGELLFLLPTMAAAHRRGERDLWRAAALELGLRPVELPGVWEAQGDVARFRGRALLFFGGRTDREGALAAARYFDDPLLLEVRQPAFHGNMALLPLERPGKLLVCPEVLVGDSLARLEQAFGAASIATVSEREIRAYATNGLPIGGDVLAPHLTPPRVRGLLASLGLRLVEPPMIELCEKAGGASRCLVSHARVDDRRVRVPASLDYRAHRPALEARLGPGLRAALSAARAAP